MKWDDRILVLAPHADDEALGCGGLLAAKKRAGKQCCVDFLSFGETPARRAVQTLDEVRASMRALGLAEEDWAIVPAGLDRQSRLDMVAQRDLVGSIDARIDEFRPTSIFVAYASHHQDHQAVYRATLAALRPREATIGVMLALYEYPYAAVWPAPELPGGKFLFLLSPADLSAKLAACAAYESQFARPGTWLTVDRVRRWAETRGEEVGEAAAEAFWLVRGILQ